MRAPWPSRSPFRFDLLLQRRARWPPSRSGDCKKVRIVFFLKKKGNCPGRGENANCLKRLNSRRAGHYVTDANCPFFGSLRIETRPKPEVAINVFNGLCSFDPTWAVTKKDFFDAGSANAVAGLPLSPHYKSLFASFSSEKEEPYFQPTAPRHPHRPIARRRVLCSSSGWKLGAKPRRMND